MQLDYLDSANHLALPSHTHQQMQMRKTNVAAASASIDYNIYKEKSKILKYITENTSSIALDGEPLGQVESFIIAELGGSDVNMKEQIYNGSGGSILTVEDHMELKTAFSQHQSQNIQFERQDSPIVQS
ncbi:unnamed protein product [Schistosoma curassoni]|uniref:Pecanex-like protein n=1 Tax=Schistosoma curassoni TaxID=6186 RepID=A0A183KH03_9TREM|nr:unnamed protein product [Schistosoma curassoni]